MIIKTKFNIKDTVYYIKDDELVKGKIEEISYENSIICYRMASGKVQELYVFASLEEYKQSVLQHTTNSLNNIEKFFEGSYSLKFNSVFSKYNCLGN